MVENDKSTWIISLALSEFDTINLCFVKKKKSKVKTG